MRRVIAPALVLAALVFPSAMSASIIIDACIAGVGPWDSSEQVLRTWGKPIRKTNDPGGRYDYWWHYPRGKVLMTRWGYEPTPNKRIVLVIETTDPRQRTPAGIGVGSWGSEVHARYRRCPTRGECDISRVANRSTTLRYKNGRVTAVSISLYSDYDDGRLQKPDPRCRRSA